MKRSVIAALAIVLIATVLLVAGITWFAAYVSAPTDLPPLPPQPVDTPLLILEPLEPDAALPPLAILPDLSKVDRRAIEPANLVKPRYCLLVFGLRGEIRVWVIEDKETLYVDRNANGDLTEAGKAFSPAEREEFMTLGEGGKQIPYRQWTYLAGDLSPMDRSARHTGLKLVRYQEGDEPAKYVLSVWVNGVTLQYAGWGPLFADSRETVPVIHFGGPVIPQVLRGDALHLQEGSQELHFSIGTPGLGNHSFAYVGWESVPATVRPVVEIAWPAEVAAVKERFALIRRC